MTTDTDPRVTRTRQNVFDTALGLAAERGFADTTINEISERSGVSKSTIYRHWDNVDDLFLDALKQTTQIHVAPNTGNLRDDFVVIMINFAQVITDTPYGTITAHLVSASATDPRFGNILATYQDHHEAIDRPILERAVERGDLPPTTDISAVYELMVAPLLFRLLFSRRPIDPKWVTTHIDHILTLAGYNPNN